MKKQDYEQLTLFQEGSPVSRSLLPGTEEARKMTVSSGLKCSESYENSTPLGCLVRMCLESSIWHSTRCLLTWKKQDTPAKRSLYRLVVSMPHTNERDVPFWPTPVSSGGMCGGTGAIKTLKAMERKGLITETERRNFQQGNGGKTNPQLLEWLMGYEQKFTELMPTPVASSRNGAAAERYWNPQKLQNDYMRGGLQSKSSRTCGMHSAWEDWPAEPGMDRVVDGVPNRADRIKCLGNAVVPQQFYPFFEAIYKIERGEM